METTALGAAFLAGLGTGVWSSTDDLHETCSWTAVSTRTPTGPQPTQATPWIEAVSRSKGWAT